MALLLAVDKSPWLEEQMKPRSPNTAPSERIPVDDREEPLPYHAFVESAAVLEDYLDEEVVDRNGKLLGTLSCYWEDGDGQLVFCGIHMNNAEEVRVVPATDVQVSERQSWVRVNYPASVVRKAPAYDCDNELDAQFERTVFEHYGMTEAQPHDRLKYLSSQSPH